jgi:hypothetical protein
MVTDYRSMRRWLRRFGYLFIFIIWLIIMSFPAVAFVLATQGQLQLGSSEQRHLRLFLLEDSEAEGVGIEWARAARGHAGCVRTSVNYIMWAGTSEQKNVSFCQCFDPRTGAPLPVDQSQCNEP